MSRPRKTGAPVYWSEVRPATATRIPTNVLRGGLEKAFGLTPGALLPKPGQPPPKPKPWLDRSRSVEERRAAYAAHIEADQLRDWHSHPGMAGRRHVHPDAGRYHEHLPDGSVRRPWG